MRYNLPDIITEDVFRLLQLGDSFFPNGSFTQSYGLETYTAKGELPDKETLLQFLTLYISNNIIFADGLVMKLAWEASNKGEVEILAEIDQLLTASKSASEVREGSRKIGGRMLKVVTSLPEVQQIVFEFAKMVKSGKSSGNHAVVFGLLAQSFGNSLQLSIFVYLYNLTSGMVNAAVKLVPLGQSDGQWVLWQLKPILVNVAQCLENMTIADFGSCMPGHDIRAMEHEYLYSRIFMS